jgi:hypothetical protein
VSPTATDLAAALAGYQHPQQTLWTPRAATGFSASTAAFSGTVTPQVGDLIIITWHGNRATTAFTGVTIGDTGSGGWTGFSTMQTRVLMTGLTWFKQATSADFNGGSGITVTITASGGSGTIANYALVDSFFLNVTGGSAYIIAGDILSATTSAATTTITVTPGAGSGLGQTDELAYFAYSSNSAPGNATGTNTFTATTPTRQLIQIANPGLLLGTVREYAGLNQPNATAANNKWVATWASSIGGIASAGTFRWIA